MTFEELLLALDEHSNLISNETKIGHNTNVRVGLLGKKVAEIFRKQGDAGERYLSKIDDDIAKGIITFLKGIVIGDFSPGLFGSGGAIKNINGTIVAEFDQLLIRQRAEFLSVLIHQAKHVGGQLVLSAADMTCIRVEETSDFYRCYFDSDGGKVVNLFENTDFARHQIFTGNRQKFYWRKIVAVGPDYIELSKTDAAINSDAPEVGDDIYQLGSTNPERQSAIILSTVGDDAPSIKQLVDINTYILSKANEYTVLSRKGNKFVGRSVFLSDGTNLDDWTTGTSQDIQDTQATANAAALKAQQAIDEAAANVVDYNTKFAEIQAQVDGEISNYSYPYKPTLLNYPASEWTTNEEKNRHVGDTFYNTQQFVDNETTPDAGKAWRFLKDGTVYSWSPIADSDSVKALKLASQAQATADGKSTTYLLKPDTPRADGYCYHFGDSWTLSTDTTVNGTLYKKGFVLTATQDSQTFNEAHWAKRDAYTDDTAVNNLEIGARNLIRNSNIERSNNNYNLASYQPSEFFVEGETYSITMEVTPAPNVTHFSAYLSGGNSWLRDININGSSKQIIRATFTAKYLTGYTPLDNPANGNILLYRLPNNGTVIQVNTIHWVNIVKGNKPTSDWSPAPEDVQAEIDDVNTGLIDLGAEIDIAFSNLSVTNIEANNLDLLRKSLVKEVADVRAIAVSMSVSVSDIDSKMAALNTEVSKYTGKADTAYPIAVTVTNRTAIETAFSDLEASIVALYETIDKKRVDDLEIGSRNFWLNSKSYKRTGAGGGWSIVSRDLSSMIDNGEQMTIQFDIEVDASWNLIIYKCSTPSIVWGTSKISTVTNVNLSVGKQTIKNTFLFDSEKPYILIYNNTVELRTSEFTNIMLGLGNKVTWSEAPEDIEAKINLAKQEALTAASNAQTSADLAQGAINDLDIYVDGAFKDGVINAAEAKAIEKYKNTINETMAQAEASYNKVYLNTYLPEGTAQTSLLNAKINLWGQRDTLLSAINTAISGGITTPTQKAAVDTAFANFNSDMAAFQNSLEEANKAIQIKLDNLSKGYVNDLEIGDRNLLLNSIINVTNNTYPTATLYLSPEGRTLVTGERVTLVIKGNLGSGKNYFSIYNSGGVVYLRDIYPTSFKDGIATVSFNWNVGTSSNVSIVIYPIPNSISVNSTIEWVKLVRGNKSTTGWSPSPEDVRGELDKEISVIKDGTNLLPPDATFTVPVSGNNYNWIAISNNLTPNTTYKLTIGSSEVLSGSFSDYTINFYDNTTLKGFGSKILPISNSQQTVIFKTPNDGILYDVLLYSGRNGQTANKSLKVNNVTLGEPSSYEIAVYANEALAKANKSAAITDKFATEINGGLITTVMMLLREVNSQANTAGFSGIQGALLDQPSYWSGGTHPQAQAFVPFVKKLENGQSTTLAEYNNLPSVVILHNGAAKIGHFIVLTTGEILIIDKNTGAIKLKFSTSDLPAIADLIAGTNSSGSTPIGAGVASNSSSQVVSGSTQISKNGATATFNGTYISINATGKVQTNGMASFAEAVLYARKDGVRLQRLAVATVYFTSGVYEERYEERLPVPFNFITDAGLYTFELVVHTVGQVSSATAITSSTNFSWKHTVAGVKQQQYAKDGMMFFYSNRHFYFNELTGLDVKESDSSKFNMPGVLLSATVNENGGWNRVWGAKQSLTQPPLPSPTGRYTIYHTIGHTNYQVNCVSYTENRSFRVYQKNTNNVIVECRTIGSTPVLVNAMFDIILTGNNY